MTASAPAANHRRHLSTLAAALALIVLVVLFRDRIHFDWRSFVEQLRQASLGHILIGIAAIYLGYYLRALRWAVFLKPVKRVSALTLLGPQVIGFTAIALFGRFADLTRPYILAKRTHLSFASQIAVYTIERMFDLGAAAIIFSLSLALTPRNDPHYSIFFRAGELSLAATAFIGIFALAIWFAGEATANLARRLFQGISRAAGDQAAEKILAFRHGLNAISSARDLAAASLISLLMWGLVGEAYVQTLHAFVQTPELASLPYSRIMLLMAVSIGGSAVQLPIIGWFTQLGIAAAAMHAFFGAPLEAATACGAVLQIVLWVSVIPVGLIWSRVDNISLKSAETAAEQAAES